MSEAGLARDEVEREPAVLPGGVLELDVVAQRAGVRRLHEEELAPAPRPDRLAGDDDAGDALADDPADDPRRSAARLADLHRDVAAAHGEAGAPRGQALGQAVLESAHD